MPSEIAIILPHTYMLPFAPDIRPSVEGYSNRRSPPPRNHSVLSFLLSPRSCRTGCFSIFTRRKLNNDTVHKKKTLMVDSRTDTPLKMTRAKRKAHMWAVFFHTLETLDVITVR